MKFLIAVTSLFALAGAAPSSDILKRCNANVLLDPV